MKILSNIYSREKTLFYFTMWNDSDRKGYKEYINHEVQYNLFIVKPAGEKGSVWYDLGELTSIEQKIKQQIVHDDSFVSRLTNRLDTEWNTLFPYLTKEKSIQSGDELEIYYLALVNWWSAMNTVFTLPDMSEISDETKALFLKYRTSSEKYTEQMNKTFISFWNEYFTQYKDILFFITPTEAIALAKGIISEDTLKEIYKRINGCFLFDQCVYPIAELDAVLEKNNITLDKLNTDIVQEIKGQTGYKTDIAITGKVRIIFGFKNMNEFESGEILVTEMTNPDYLPVMKMAAAIITDEGGITCHAAIASRELKIPCIIGTKIATKVLQNGDMVTIDTNSGIVTRVV